MEDFVNFSLAKKLKEKGYPNKTPHQYNGQGQICVSIVGEDYPYPCPEIHQVLKWLREDKNVEVIPSFDYEERIWGYQVGDMNLRVDVILAYLWDFKTYESAALAGILYCLDNLI